MRVTTQVANGARPSKPESETLAYTRGFDLDLWELCEMCWKHSPQDRPAMAEVLNDKALRYAHKLTIPPTAAPYFALAFL